MLGLLSLSLLGSLAAGAATHSSEVLLRSSRTKGVVTTFEFKHRLRVCNAYPNAGAIDVYRDESEKLTTEPMPYKTCKDFKAPLRSGDKLEFKVGDASAGTFAVADLPKNDAVLLLVIHRHDTLSTAVSFESHVFANLANAQVAVIDTYKGVAHGTPHIMDMPASGQPGRDEALRYDSVVAVNPGVYKVALDDSQGQERATSELVALPRESYVILRTGVESKDGHSYPEDVMVFPQSDPASVRSSAVHRSTVAGFLTLLVGSFLSQGM
mmetsp:Transcript_66694/g.145432  ORF Transcript_66694/g.145432 Transcript_66694/m.145432 type:complete len:268 (+) Transcript_66694:52-855(+)|eukprot:CAMPEP_0170597710 /NCGR_PEP_ID=MMETSP0224-20130122/15852_1 /TAXON_ID=285029 /ORGANISM="Togula jolla, Strain CCCM 725" /LENGTH=267 /DNA_ID=CAMNT_0010922199 /DNA_START=52 /DNA_END=855 /DNA_ORIENTATION=+